ncbi:hypothetical protein BRC79_09685, partial [Halobacteriales archaeon QH_8_67_27]
MPEPLKRSVVDFSVDRTVGRRTVPRGITTTGTLELILPAVSLSRISPPRGGKYLHEVTAGSITP